MGTRETGLKPGGRESASSDIEFGFDWWARCQRQTLGRRCNSELTRVGEEGWAGSKSFLRNWAGLEVEEISYLILFLEREFWKCNTAGSSSSSSRIDLERPDKREIHEGNPDRW
jgi:hypothetical protein